MSSGPVDADCTYLTVRRVKEFGERRLASTALRSAPASGCKKTGLMLPLAASLPGGYAEAGAR